MSLPTDNAERKALPILKWLTEYFPDAIVECVKVSVAGNIQHNPERDPADIVWARGKSMNQLDTAFRHLWDHKLGQTRDSDGQYHLAKTAWRALAELQLTIERERSGAREIGLIKDVKVSSGRVDIYHACPPKADGSPSCGVEPSARCLWLLGSSAIAGPASE